MASETIDDMMASVMSMGFELKDAQDAVHYGKMTTQEVVEWILAGKPGFAASGTQPPVLKLGGQVSSLKPDSQAPFSRPHALPADTPASTTPSATPSGDPASAQSGSTVAQPSSSDTDMEHQVVSRLHLTEERSAHKKSFEEKERNEAKRQAKLEKMQAKREHERVLKEIAEDRKINKMMRVHGPVAPSTETDGSAPSNSTPAVAASSSSVSTATLCSLQIRLPSGKQLRKKLEKTSTLGQVWTQVLDEAGDQEGYCGFMQPFPHREFTAPEMNKTLEDLGLMPSGSLVLRKENKSKEPAASAAAAQEEAAEARPEVAEAPAEASGSNNEAIPSPPLGGPGPWEPVVTHSWGRGRALDNADNQEAGEDDEPEAMEGQDEEEQEVRDDGRHTWGRGRALEGDDAAMEIDNGNENNLDGPEDDDDDDDDQWAAPQGFGGGGGGGGGGGFNAGAFLGGMLGQQGAGGMGFGRGQFMGRGQRMVLPGQPGVEDYNNRRYNDLAAEAAQHRLALPAPEVPQSDLPSPPPLAQVPALQDVCFAMVADRISDPVNPVRSLGPMPPNLSQRFLQHLLREKLLDPKTIKIFMSCYLQRLILDTYTYATNELLYSLRLHHSLQIVSLHSCPLISDHGIKHLANLKNLKVLNLGLCKQITNNTLKFIAGLPQLHTLSLEETGVTDAGLGQYFSANPNLRHLNLNRTAVTNDIFQHLKNLKHLQLLYLEETKISSLSGVEALTQLETLNVASTPIPTDSLHHLAHHPALTQLNFTNTDNLVGDTALSYLQGLKLKALCLPDRHTVTGHGLVHITGFPLTTLDLTNYIHVGDEGMEHVGRITSLRKLMLSNTKMSDKGLLDLGGLTRLKILYLDRTSVSDVGITVVKEFKQLAELSLSETNVTSRFLKQGILHNCQGLTKLNLSRTIVGDQGVVVLRLPYLVLLNLDCTRVHARVVDTVRQHCPALKSVTTANLTPVMEDAQEMEEEEGGQG